MDRNELLRAKKKALNWLTDRDRSVYELTEKLKKAEFSDEVVEETLSYVKSFGYLDDDKYARHYIEFYRQSRSRQRIRFDLIKKGVDKECIERAFDSFESYDEKELIRHLIEKKSRTVRLDGSDRDTKIIQSLARKGFSVGEIRSVLDEMKSE